MPEQISFAGRTMVIVGKHKKERVIAPIMEKVLGVTCITVPEIDTDLLGTFSGEIERADDVITTLRKKCALAAEKYPGHLIVASEGSFGMHPVVPLAHADDEVMLCVDYTNQLEFFARKLTTVTNFNAQEIHSVKNLMHFAIKAQFPQHALILRRSKTDNTHITKGIQDETTLREVYQQLRARFGQAYIETDMRALFNPTRMKVIGEVAEDLAGKMNSRCPVCTHPGFSVQDAVSGLPCGMCGTPTQTTQHLVLRCTHCGHSALKAPLHGKKVEDPQFCDFCNP